MGSEQRWERIWIHFVDGACLGSSTEGFEQIESYYPAKPINHNWFDALVIVNRSQPTIVQGSVSSAPFEKYLPALIADYWGGWNTNIPYYKTWKVTLVSGGTDVFEFTCKHQADAAKFYNQKHPHAQVAAIVPNQPIYLSKMQRDLIDADPISANRPISEWISA